MKTTTRILALILAVMTLNPVMAQDLDDFVPADNDNIGSSQIADGAITSDKIADGAVNANKLGTSSVQNAHIASGAVTGDKILNGTVDTADLADGAVDGGKISNNSIQAIDIAPNTITDNEIAPAAITSSELAANAVNSDKILDGSIVSADIAANSINSNHIINGSVTAADLAAGVISSVGSKYAMLDIGSSIRTSLSIGTVGSGYGASPVLRYDDGDSYSRWSMPVPDDYVPGTDIVVELIWSASNTTIGNVTWALDYLSMAPGEVVPGASGFVSKSFIQATSGATLGLVSTASNLTISAADIGANEMLNIVVRRAGNDGTDTYTNSANLHLAKIIYQAKKVN